MHLSRHRLFWIEQPALLLGLTVLIGTSSSLFWTFPWNGIFPILWSTYLIALRYWPHILLIFASAIYATTLHSGTPKGELGYFSIASLQPHQSPFQKGLLYKGMLFTGDHRIPCHISHPLNGPPKANCDYVVKGSLKMRAPYTYFFKAKEWIPIQNTWSFAELRFQLKENFRKFLDQKLHRPRTATFLSSLITGDVEDRSLRYEFGRLGLQHILAISGFHFAILIAFCSFFLSLFLPHRWKIITLLILINLYFLFVGSVPAVQRSWLMAMLYLMGNLIGRHSSGLNLLGVALLIEVILDPLIAAHLGFQLSFLSCVGILLYRPLFTTPLLTLLPTRSPDTLSPLSQHLYLLSSFLRQGLSINLAVNLAILPLLLLNFHQFPLLALLYNLFFPFLVSAALFGLLITLLLHILAPPIASLCFPLIDAFTSQLLDLAAYPPLPLDYSLTVPNFPAWIIPPYLFALFCISITYRNVYEKY